MQILDQQGNHLYLNGEEHEGPLLAESVLIFAEVQAHLGSAFRSIAELCRP